MFIFPRVKRRVLIIALMCTAVLITDYYLELSIPPGEMAANPNGHPKAKELWSPSKSLPTRKIIYDQFNMRIHGYCNCVYSLLSAFAIAVLTDRQFLIYWPGIEKYIQEPFPNTFISDATLRELRGNQTHWFSSGNYGWAQFKNIKYISSRRIGHEDKPIINYSNMVAFFFEVCSNPIYYERLLSVGLVSDETVQKARLVIEKVNETQNDLVVDLVYQIGNYISSVLSPLTFERWTK